MAQSMKIHLKKSTKSFFHMEVGMGNYFSISNIVFPDATTYSHHVFKAFDIESTGSINFRVRHGFSVPQNISWLVAGHAGVPVHAVARDAIREADVDLPCVRPER